MGIAFLNNTNSGSGTDRMLNAADAALTLLHLHGEQSPTTSPHSLIPGGELLTFLIV